MSRTITVPHFPKFLTCPNNLSPWNISTVVFGSLVYLVALWVFAMRFGIWLLYEYLQHISVFGCVVSIHSTLMYLVALWVFAAHVLLNWWRCFQIFLFVCFLQLQRVELSQPPYLSQYKYKYSICMPVILSSKRKSSYSFWK